jgi:hypothetical protein
MDLQGIKAINSEEEIQSQMFGKVKKNHYHSMLGCWGMGTFKSMI